MKLSLAYPKQWLSANRRPSPDKAAFVAAVILLAWFAGNVASPFLLPAGTVDFGEDGAVGDDEHAVEIAAMDSAFARFFYSAGDANCHQLAHRSFFLNGNQMPFCARCTSIFLGLVAGTALLIFLSIELNIFWIILGLVPMALDGGIQLLRIGYESTNGTRFATGLLAGIVTGIALGYIVSEFTGMAVRSRQARKKGPG